MNFIPDSNLKKIPTLSTHSSCVSVCSWENELISNKILPCGRRRHLQWTQKYLYSWEMHRKLLIRNASACLCMNFVPSVTLTFYFFKFMTPTPAPLLRTRKGVQKVVCLIQKWITFTHKTYILFHIFILRFNRLSIYFSSFFNPS